MLRYRRELALALILGLWLTTDARAQDNRADWELLLPQSRLSAVTVWNDRIVGADALGGLFIYDPANDAVMPFTTADGATSNRTLSLMVRDDGDLWVGTADASIMRIDAGLNVRPISTLLAAQGEIRAMDQDGGRVYYATDGGGGVITNGQPGEQFTREGGLPSDDLVDVAAFEDRVWFATPNGVGLYDRLANSLGAVNTGLPGLDVSAVEAGPDGVFASVGGSILRLDETVPASPVWTEILPAPGLTVRDFRVVDGEIVVLGSVARIVRRALDATDWDFQQGDASFDLLALHFGPDRQVWTAGRRTANTLGDRDTPFTLSSPIFWSPVDGASPELAVRMGESATAILGDGEGGAWLAYRSPQTGLIHWRADGSVYSYPLLDTEGEQGEGDGWITGEKFAIRRTPNGDLWVSNFAGRGGLTRFRPDPSDDPLLAEYFHLTISDDVLKTRRILDMEVDSAGRIWLVSDAGAGSGERNRGIDVLIDPDNPTLPGSWIKVTAANSGLASDELRTISIDDRVVWLGVVETGLQRWDLAGSFDDLNAAKIQTGRWRTISRLPETGGVPLALVTDIEVGPDGRVWVATGDRGVFSFVDSLVEIADVVEFRVTEIGPSLVANQTERLAGVGAAEAWAGGEGGLHHLRFEDNQIFIDPYVDIGFFLDAALVSRFGDGIISPLPNTRVRSLFEDAENGMLYVGTELGAARIRLRQVGESLPAAFDVTVRPNPIRSDDELRVSDFEGTLDVYIYTLGGRLVSTARDVVDGDRIWDTRNVTSDRVVSGLYLVRFVRNDGAEIVKTVAIER